jgi:signal peptidase complex subunit 3
MRADVAPLLNSYNTKQLFLYLTAAYVDDVSGEAHEVVLWDRIITRGNLKDFRSTGDAVARKNRSPRPKIRMDDVKNKYTWRNPSRSFK